MDNILIRVQEVHKKFYDGQKSLHVLKGVNLDIYSGSSLVITGASGAGKSTLLHIIGTLEKPTAGNIFYLGEELTSMSEEELSKFRNRTMGFVFQFHHLLPEFSALENVMFPALIAKVPLSEAESRARALLGEMGLMERAHHKPAELSGGEQQRVAVARALELSPQIIFADEPTGNLDSSNSEIIFKLLLKFSKERNVALIVVTHNENLKNLFDRSMSLKDGVLEEN